MREAQLAWAAGLYDGEGSASAYLPKKRSSYRWQMAISQGGLPDETPEVLTRFKATMRGVESITGPYRGYLYYWKISKKTDVAEVASWIWPYLGTVKKRQFADVAALVRRPVPGPVALLSLPVADLEVSWAAGLFDGEATISVIRRRRWPNWRGVVLSLPQSSDHGVPENLTRFRRAVGELGQIRAPLIQRNPWSRLPQYRWALAGRHLVTQMAVLLWPWLSGVKRSELAAASPYLDVDFRQLQETGAGTAHTSSR